MRIGHGFDVHRFDGAGPIRIAGVDIDYPKGLLAHSDGDVALHALCDALLGAMALGDIGKHFPDSDARFTNINSRQLLKQVASQMYKRHYRLGNIDLTLVAQMPRLAPYIETMRNRVAEDLCVDIDLINIKATTTEQLGYLGRQEGIACYAVAIIIANNKN